MAPSIPANKKVSSLTRQLQETFANEDGNKNGVKQDTLEELNDINNINKMNNNENNNDYNNDDKDDGKDKIRQEWENRLDDDYDEVQKTLDLAYQENKRIESEMEEFEKTQQIRNNVFIKHLTELRRPGTPRGSKTQMNIKSNHTSRSSTPLKTENQTEDMLKKESKPHSSEPLNVPKYHNDYQEDEKFLAIDIEDDKEEESDDEFIDQLDSYEDNEKDIKILELSALIEKLKVDLELQNNINKNIKEENSSLKEKIHHLEMVTEKEEEITLKLNNRINNLKKEKGDLLIKVEQEEEMITNNLQKKLQQLQREKIQMELALEQEQEFIVNRLQKQLSVLRQQNYNNNFNNNSSNSLTILTSPNNYITKQYSNHTSLSSSVSSLRNAFHSPITNFTDIPIPISPNVIEMLRAEINTLKIKNKKNEQHNSDMMKLFNDYYSKMRMEVINLRNKLDLSITNIDNLYPPLILNSTLNEDINRRNSIKSNNTSISSINTHKAIAPSSKMGGSSISSNGYFEEDNNSIKSIENVSNVSSTGGIYGSLGNSSITGSLISNNNNSNNNNNEIYNLSLPNLDKNISISNSSTS